MCHEHGIKVESVPGPTAFATALAISGMPSGRFTFEGFLSVNKASRTEHIQSIVKEPRTMIFYEAPHKLSATLRDLAAALGDREIAIVRELTKIHEEVIRTTLCAAAEKYANGGLKGEIVLIIEGAKPEEKEKMTVEQAVEEAKRFVSNGDSASEAAKKAAKLSGLKRATYISLCRERRTMAEALKQYWYLAVALVAVAIFTVWVVKKAAEAAGRTRAEREAHMKKLEYESGVRKEFAELSEEKLRSADKKRAFDGVAMNIQRYLEKQSNMNAAFAELPDAKKQIYALYYLLMTLKRV